MGEERIYLVPGFFGFANLGELKYFGHVHRLLDRRLEAAGTSRRPGGGVCSGCSR